jgi:hypothetical protein
VEAALLPAARGHALLALCVLISPYPQDIAERIFLEENGLEMELAVAAKASVSKSRPLVTADVARNAVRVVMAKRGAKPIGASQWLRSLPAERQASLRERFLGHFGPPASRDGKKVAKPRPARKKKVVKTKAAAKRTMNARGR